MGIVCGQVRKKRSHKWKTYGFFVWLRKGMVVKKVAQTYKVLDDEEK